MKKYIKWYNVIMAGALILTILFAYDFFFSVYKEVEAILILKCAILMVLTILFDILFFICVIYQRGEFAEKISVIFKKLGRILGYLSMHKILGYVVLLILIAVGVASVIYGLIVSNLEKIAYQEKVIPYTSVCSVTEELTKSNIYEQSFQTELDVIEGIYLRTATYKRVNTSNIRIIISMQKDGTLLLDQTYSCSTVKNNNFSYFPFAASIYLGEDHDLICQVSSVDNTGGNGICLYYNTNDFHPNNLFFINGEKQEGDCFLLLDGRKVDNEFLKIIFWTLILVTSIFLVLSAYLIYKRKNVEMEKMFLVIASFIGCIFIIIMPPLTEHDGEAHFNTIYKYSNKMLGYDNSSYDDRVFSKSAEDIVGKQFEGAPSVISYYSVKKLIQEEKTHTGKRFEVNELALDIFWVPLEYFAAVLGLSIGRLLNIDIIYLFYITRICNFITYLIVVYYAIKITPIMKKLFLSVAIMPAALFQAASVSYDATVMAAIFFIIALSLYLQNNRPKFYQLILLSFFLLILSYVKGGAYIPIAGICLFIPLKRYFSHKAYYGFWLVQFLMISITFVNNYLHVNVTQNVETVYSLFDAIKHPLFFVKIVGMTIYEKFESYFKGLFGINIFRCTEKYIPLVLCVLILVIVIHFSREDFAIQPYIYKFKKSLIIFVLISCFFIFAGALSWTTIDSTSIWGVQGRYFLPLILPAASFICEIKPTNVQTNTQGYMSLKSKNIFYLYCVVEVLFVFYVMTMLLISK